MSGARVEYFGPGMNYGSRGKVSHLTLSSSLPPYQPATYHLSGAAIAVMATYSRENGRYVEGMEGGGEGGRAPRYKIGARSDITIGFSPSAVLSFFLRRSWFE